MPVLELVTREDSLPKRGHGQGSLRKRGNSYAIRYRIPGGEQVQETIGPDKEAAELALAQRIVELKRGQISAEQEAYTLRKTAKDWLASVDRNPGIKPATKQGWHTAIESHLIPAMGSRPISRITVAQLIEYLDAKRDGVDSIGQVLPVADTIEPGQRLSPATLRQHRTALRKLWEWAVIRGRCEHNIVKDIPRDAKPKISRESVKVIERSDVRKLIAQTSGQDRRMIQVLVSLGLRLGELLGLQVADYNASQKLLHVQRTIRRGSGDTWTTEGDETKTFAGDRYLRVSPELGAILEEQIAGKRRGELIFASQAGTILNPGNWRTRKWQPACDAIGIPDATPHMLRHTFASYQIVVLRRSGFEVSRLMGHEDASITLRVYTHFFREQQAHSDQEATDILSAYGEEDDNEDPR